MNPKEIILLFILHLLNLFTRTRFKKFQRWDTQDMCQMENHFERRIFFNILCFNLT